MMDRKKGKSEKEKEEGKKRKGREERTGAKREIKEAAEKTAEKRTKRGRNVLGLALALVLTAAVLTFFACGAKKMRYFGYLDTAARAELKIVADAVTYRARLESGMRDPSGALPDLTLTFIAPPSLCGVSVSYRKDTGVWRATLGELEVEGDFSAMAQAGQLLLCESAVQSSVRGRQCIDGTWYDTVTLTTQDGATRMLDVATGQPLLVRAVADGRAWEITVTRWERQP